MCGIAGVFHYGSRAPVEPRQLGAMTDAMVHRGPDDSGYLFDGPLGLGMRRLSIIDLAGGAQPIANEAGNVWVVFNGEIYNFRELRGELRALGHVFSTQSDTEVVVHAYEQWGGEALSRLNGMFALALWDQRRQLLTVARDPHGIKPLYYHDDGERLIFASEIRPILAVPGVPRSLDKVALDEFLTLGFVPSPKTALADISKLLPGHALVYGLERRELRRFHSVAGGELRNRNTDELVEMLRHLVKSAVQRQLVADVPVGVMLSGGSDSTAIASIMAEITEGPLDTFTVGFSGDFAKNELEPARWVAERLGSRHHEVVISASEFVDFLPFAVRSLEEPVATASTLPFFKLCQLARQHVKVVLTGQGADEPFAGYARYLGQHYAGWYQRIPEAGRKAITGVVDSLPRNEQLKRGVHALGIEEPVDRMLAIYRIVDSRQKRSLYREGLASDECLNSVRQWSRDVESFEPLNQMLYVDARTSLSDNLLLYGDKMSMAASLEARVPFLDLDLMAFAEALPANMKIRRLGRKYILKRALSEWVPPSILQRRKVGFVTPVDEWFRGALKDQLRDMLLDPASACMTYFTRSAIERMLNDHRTGRHDYKRPLFSLLIFDAWHREFLQSRDFGQVERSETPAVARLG